MIKRSLVVIVLILQLTSSVLSQRKAKKEGPSYMATSSIHISPNLPNFDYYLEIEAQGNDDVDLTFLTSNSGTFTLEEGQEYLYKRTFRNVLPFQKISFGMGFQINLENKYHEFTISNVSYSTTESTSLIELEFLDNEPTYSYISGESDKYFSFGIGYEYGRYFDNKKNKNIKFGIGFSLNQLFYSYTRDPYSKNIFQLKGTLNNVEFGLVPRLLFNISEKFSLQFKGSPSILLFTKHSFKLLNPNLDARNRNPIKNNGRKFGAVKVAYALGINFLISPSKSRRAGR